MQQQFLSTSELAHRLNVPKSWIYVQVRENAFPKIKVGKYLRFNWDDVWEWIQAKQKKSEVCVEGGMP